MSSGRVISVRASSNPLDQILTETGERLANLRLIAVAPERARCAPESLDGLSGERQQTGSALDVAVHDCQPRIGLQLVKHCVELL